jgi:cyclopropane fatty-acyl-phospholipid synthase-like methyltransferase
MTASTEVGYQFGHDNAELERLTLQGRALGPATRTILEMAGIEPGMAVLDLGSGAGDVSLLAAELVGPSGRVTGIDASADAVARAAGRARERNMTNVQFAVGDIHRPAPGGPFDVITGRLVLMYVADPPAVLRTQATVLRAGGRVVPIELDISTARTVPPTPLAGRLASWIAEVFNRGGIHGSLGPQLWSTIDEAGLHPRGMIGIQTCFDPDNPDGAALLAGVVRTLGPLMERTNVATIDEIQPATLQDRLATELSEARGTFMYPTLYGAWGTLE